MQPQQQSRPPPPPPQTIQETTVAHATPHPHEAPPPVKFFGIGPEIWVIAITTLVAALIGAWKRDPIGRYIRELRERDKT